jgi:anti-anti-sigma regulatory factor
MPEPGHRRDDSSYGPGSLKLRSFRAGDARVVALAEVFDDCTMEQVDRELDDAEGTDAQIIVLDLRLLEFIDSGRLRVVVITGARSPASDTPG